MCASSRQRKRDKPRDEREMVRTRKRRKGHILRYSPRPALPRRRGLSKQKKRKDNRALSRRAGCKLSSTAPGGIRGQGLPFSSWRLSLSPVWSITHTAQGTRTKAMWSLPRATRKASWRPITFIPTPGLLAGEHVDAQQETCARVLHLVARR